MLNETILSGSKTPITTTTTTKYVEMNVNCIDLLFWLSMYTLHIYGNMPTMIWILFDRLKKKAAHKTIHII